MPGYSGADLEYRRLLAAAGLTDGKNMDGARLEQMALERREVTESTLSSSYAARANALPVQARVRKPSLSDITIISDWEAGHGWTLLSGTDVDLNDTTHPLIGNQSIRYNLGAGVTRQLDKTGVSLNLVDRDLVVIMLGESGPAPGVSVFISDATFANYERFTIAAGNTSLDPAEGWTVVRFRGLAARNENVGTLDRANVLRLRMLLSTGASASSGYVAAIGTVPREYANGAITLTFDDAAPGLMDHAVPAMAKRGYPGQAYVIGENVDNATLANGASGRYMCQMLEDTFGWEVGGHARTNADHVDLTTLNPVQLEDNLLRMREWLTAAKLSGRHFAFPFGGSSINTDTLAAVRRHFATARGVSGSTVPYKAVWGTSADHYNLIAPSFGSTNVTLAFMQSQIDYVKTNKSWGVLTFHEIVSGASTGDKIGRADFETLCAYIQSQGVQVVTLSSALNVR